MALPPNLQNGLAGTTFGYTGIQINPPQPPRNPPAPAPLDPALRHQLGASFAQSISQDWSIQRQTQPLSPDEIAFLRSHTVEEITASFASPPGNPLLAFCLDILKNVTIQLASSAITQAFARAEAPQTEARRVPASDGKIGYEADAPSIDTDSNDTSKKDPSAETMKKIAKGSAKSLTGKFVSREMGNQLKSLGDAAENEKFLKYASKTVKTAAVSAKFLSKVEEIGWQGASAELAKEVTIGFMAKYSAKIVAGAVGCTNPVWCAGVLTQIIVGTLEPTETAPPSHDMRPPLPTPSLEQVTQSRLPHLNPPYPALQAPGGK